MSLITIKHQKDLCVTATIRNHTLILNAPPEPGGRDAGLTPVELLTTAVGTCMATHIAKYCKAAKLPLVGLVLTLDAQVARDPPHVASITAVIELPPEFPSNGIAPVKCAAEGSIVRNTLSENTSVDIEILAGVT